MDNAPHIQTIIDWDTHSNHMPYVGWNQKWDRCIKLTKASLQYHMEIYIFTKQEKLLHSADEVNEKQTSEQEKSVN